MSTSSSKKDLQNQKRKRDVEEKSSFERTLNKASKPDTAGNKDYSKSDSNRESNAEHLDQEDDEGEDETRDKGKEDDEGEDETTSETTDEENREDDEQRVVDEKVSDDETGKYEEHGKTMHESTDAERKEKGEKGVEKGGHNKNHKGDSHRALVNTTSEAIQPRAITAETELPTADITTVATSPTRITGTVPVFELKLTATTASADVEPETAPIDSPTTDTSADQGRDVSRDALPVERADSASEFITYDKPSVAVQLYPKPDDIQAKTAEVVRMSPTIGIDPIETRLLGPEATAVPESMGLDCPTPGGSEMDDDNLIETRIFEPEPTAVPESMGLDCPTPGGIDTDDGDYARCKNSQTTIGGGNDPDSDASGEPCEVRASLEKEMTSENIFRVAIPYFTVKTWRGRRPGNPRNNICRLPCADVAPWDHLPRLATVEWKGYTYSCQDDVFIFMEDGTSSLARIHEIRDLEDGRKQISVLWYYSKEDREKVRSNLTDWPTRSTHILTNYLEVLMWDTLNGPVGMDDMSVDYDSALDLCHNVGAIYSRNDPRVSWIYAR